MLPHLVQGALDRWVTGSLTEGQCGLVHADLQFARMHKVSMLAINVDRTLVRKVGEQGWAAIAPNEREGITDPAPAPGPYVDMPSLGLNPLLPPPVPYRARGRRNRCACGAGCTL
jgi:heme-binding uptake protein ChaN (Tiki superfamily)